MAAKIQASVPHNVFPAFTNLSGIYIYALMEPAMEAGGDVPQKGLKRLNKQRTSVILIIGL